jgi:hypothetical protein
MTTLIFLERMHDHPCIKKKKKNKKKKKFTKKHLNKVLAFSRKHGLNLFSLLFSLMTWLGEDSRTSKFFLNDPI